MPDTLPQPDVAREWLAAMTLIRRFEERAGEMYARAKIGGFLHLSIGEEATIVGSARALRDSDYLISHVPLARPRACARHAAGERDGRAIRQAWTAAARARRLDAHVRRRSGASWAATGSSAATCRSPPASRWPATTRQTDEVTLCTFGDGASNQGTFGETLNLAALWRLPVVFMVTNNQFGMGTALSRHSAVTDLRRKGESARRARHALRRDGRRSTPIGPLEAVARVREERRPLLVEAVTYRFRGHSMADPEDYRTKEEVAQLARARPDPSVQRATGARGRTHEAAARADRPRGAAAGRRSGRVRRALPASPTRTSLYEDVYVLERARPMAGTRSTRPPRRHSAARHRAAARPRRYPPAERRARRRRGRRRPAGGDAPADAAARGALADGRAALSRGARRRR